MPVSPGFLSSEAGSHSHTRRGDVECAASDSCGLLVLGRRLRLKSWSNASEWRSENVSVGFGRNAETKEAPVGRSRSAYSGVKFAFIAVSDIFVRRREPRRISSVRLIVTNYDSYESLLPT